MTADLIHFFTHQLAGPGDRHPGAVPGRHGAAAGGRGLHDLRRPQGLGLDPAPPRPQRGRPVRPAAALRRRPEAGAEGDHRPVERQRRAVHHRADDHLHDGAGRLGGRAVRRRLGHRRHQCRHPLPVRHLLARRLRHHHRRLGVELEVRLPGRAALGGADGVLRGLDRLRADHRAALRRLAQPLQGRARPVRLVLELVLAAAAADVRDLLRLGAGRDQPHAVRPADVGSRAGGGLPHRILGDDLRPVLPRRIRQHDPAVGAGRGAVPRRLDVADPVSRPSPGSPASSGSRSRSRSCCSSSAGPRARCPATATTS